MRRSLADLERLYAAAHTGAQRCDLRSRARRLAALLEVDVPEWASLKASAAQRQIATQKPASAPMPRRRARGPLPAGSVGPGVDTTIPPELREWRARALGGIVQISRAGVVLHEFGAPPRRFKTVEAACAAVTP